MEYKAPIHSAPLRTTDECRRLLKDKLFVQLLINHPFFCTLLMKQELVETDANGRSPFASEPIPGMAVDGVYFFYNPHGWLRHLTNDVLLTMGVHEANHLALKHPLRGMTRNMEDCFAEACEHENNCYIKQIPMPLWEGAVCDAQFENMFAEEIDDILRKRPKMPGGGKKQGKGQGQGQGKGQGQQQPGDDGEGEGEGEGNGDGDGGGPPSLEQLVKFIRPTSPSNPGQPPTQEELNEMQQKLTSQVVQAAIGAKARGHLPAGYERLISEMLEHKVPWTEKLQDFADRVFRTDVAWRRPSTKLLAHDIFLPGPELDGIGELIIAIDTSGSMSDEMLKQAGGEADEVVTRCKPKRVLALYCDARVDRVQEYHSGDEFEFQPTGGGGTSARPVWKYIKDNCEDPQAVIYFTDMYMDWGDEPPFPVLWVNVADNDIKAPFGESIKAV